MINYNLYQRIDNCKQNFNNNSCESYQQLLLLIYDIYGNNNNFVIIPQYLKINLKNTIGYLIYKYELKYENINHPFAGDKQDYINYIICFYNLLSENKQIPLQLLLTIEQILLQNNIITIEYLKQHYSIYTMPPRHSEEEIIAFFKTYNIDLEQDNILVIKDVKIPNFYLQYKVHLMGCKFEFCHLLFKLYASYLEQGFFFYEAGIRKITSDDVVFDCGSNMGLFAAYAAAKGAQVYCFEPMSLVRDLLIQMKQVYPNNIHIIPQAIGKYPRVKYFNQGFNPGTSNNNTLEKDFITLYKEQVEVIKLDDFIIKNQLQPTFIKMDIEGGESDALDGCEKYIKENKPDMVICLDHHGDDKTNLVGKIMNFNNNYQYKFFIENRPDQLYALFINA